MSKLAAIFACTTAMAVIVVVQLWHQLDAERASNQQLQASATRNAALQARAREQARGSQQIGVVAPVAAGNAAPMAPAAAGTAQANAPGPVGIDMQQLLKDPKFREAQQAQARLQMPQTYPDVARVLGLTPAEAEEFFDLLAKQQFARMTLATAAGEGSENDRKEAASKLLKTQQDDQADLARLLGPNREQAWKDYQQGVGARRQVNQLGTLLSAAGHPLTDEQARPLVALMVAEQQRLKGDSRSRTYSLEPGVQVQYDEAILKATEESNNRIVESARPYLDSHQLAALKTSMAQRTTMARVVVNAQHE